jgi:hypothetical protein
MASKRLPVLCPQSYEGTDMRVTPCTRCPVGWDKTAQTCNVEIGCEHLPLVSPAEVPACPIVDRCQHQRQSDGPCIVRSRGLVCESALVHGGMSADTAAVHPLSFHAMTVITAEELESTMNIPNLRDQLIRLLREVGEDWRPRTTTFCFEDDQGHPIYECGLGDAIEYATPPGRPDIGVGRVAVRVSARTRW